MLIIPKNIIQVLCQKKIIKHSTSNVYRYFKTSTYFAAGSSQKTSPEEDEERQQEQKQRYKEEAPKTIAVRGLFNEVDDKTKTTYLEMLKIFENRDVHRRGHVEFIYAALRSMENYNVHTDLQVYKALLDVMPKGKFIPNNMFQAEFMHFPKQQQCIIDLLEQMEDNGVMPDAEMESMLINVFGKRGHPVRKYWRMMYWMPKFKNLSPWLLPNPVPNETLELAKMAMERMCTVDLQSKIQIYQTSDVKSALDDTWVISGQSKEQIRLLDKHDQLKSLHIEGPFLIWLRNKSINYFTLRGDPAPKTEVVEEVDIDGLFYL